MSFWSTLTLGQDVRYGLRVAPNDPAALAGAVAVWLVAALHAGFLPARRASRIEPLGAMRSE